MKRFHALVSICLLAVSGATLAQPSTRPGTDAAKPSAEQAHRADDAARHRQMARAHEEAARCLEAGTPEKQCQERLREACKGIAVGQYCGMRHAH